MGELLTIPSFLKKYFFVHLAKRCQLLKCPNLLILWGKYTLHGFLSQLNDWQLTYIILYLFTSAFVLVHLS